MPVYFKLDPNKPIDGQRLVVQGPENMPFYGAGAKNPLTNDAGMAALENVLDDRMLGSAWQRHRVKTAATTNATSIKPDPGRVGGYALFNNAATDRWVKFYDKASAPTVGTDIPAFTVKVPAGGGANVGWPRGVEFKVGIAYAVTAGASDTDTTATGVDDVTGVVLYE